MAIASRIHYPLDEDCAIHYFDLISSFRTQSRLGFRRNKAEGLCREQAYRSAHDWGAEPTEMGWKAEKDRDSVGVHDSVKGEHRWDASNRLGITVKNS
jgi:hypothetical protein